MYVQHSVDSGATFTQGADINAFSMGCISVAGGGTLAGVIAVVTGDLWLRVIEPPGPDVPVVVVVPDNQRPYTMHSISRLRF